MTEELEARLNPQQLQELLEEPIISMVTTIRPDGTPHTTPVWHYVDGDEVIVASVRTSVKVRNVRINPNVALCIAAHETPQRWMLLNGTATISEDRVEELVRAVSLHYLGTERGEPYADNVLEKLEFVIIRITPTRTIGFVGTD